jgi:hypothetical protein
MACSLLFSALLARKGASKRDLKPEIWARAGAFLPDFRRAIVSGTRNNPGPTPGIIHNPYTNEFFLSMFFNALTNFFADSGCSAK